MNVPAVYYINLDSRTDRRSRFEEHWNGIFSLAPVRFSAIKNTVPSNSPGPGVRGCGASHAELILRMETDPSIPYIVVLEDDAERTSDFATDMPAILKYLETHPTEWDIVNCGTNTVIGLHAEVHAPPTISYVTDQLFRTTLWSNTQMMIYNRSLIPIAREYLTLMHKGKIPMKSHYSHNDVYFSTHPHVRSLMTARQLTAQYVDWSDNQELVSDQRATFARAAADLKQLVAYFSNPAARTTSVTVPRVPHPNMIPHPCLLVDKN